MLKLHLVASCAGGDQDVGSRDRDAGRTCASCKFERGGPNVIVDGEFGQQSLEIPQYFFFSIAARAIPQFQPDDRAPAGLAGIKRAGYAVPDCRIPIRPKHVNPGGRVD